MVVGDVTTAVDVLVLGAGPGGYVAAIRAAQLGHSVTLVDQGPPGGTCLNRGCIPLKALLSATERYAQMRSDDLASMGIAAEAVSFDWASMQGWKQGVVGRLTEGVRRLLAGNRIDYVFGTGWFINPQEVRVEGEHGSHRFKFEHCILATGAEATPLPNLPFDGKQVLPPEQALMLPTLPETLSIFGDDYITLEPATLFARLDVKVDDELARLAAIVRRCAVDRDGADVEADKVEREAAEALCRARRDHGGAGDGVVPHVHRQVERVMRGIVAAIPQSGVVGIADAGCARRRSTPSRDGAGREQHKQRQHGRRSSAP